MKKIIMSISFAVLIFALLVQTKEAKETFPIYINEIAASNKTVLTDEDGEYVDWIELYNDSDRQVDLTGYGLSDQKENPGRWTFPDTVMEARSYLVIFASGKDRKDPTAAFHTNFKINAVQETIYFSDPQGKMLSSVEIKKLRADQTYGKVTGTEKYVVFFTPTPGMENSGETAVFTKETKKITFSHTAGYYENEIRLQLKTSQKDAQIYYTLDGTTPDFTSFRYTGDPLLISERTEEENQYTDLWCTPVDFWKGEGYTYDPSPQYKATVVKARIYLPKEDCWSDEVWTNTYLIGADYTMPIVSLSIAEELLFDEDNGIYVPGQKMQEYICSLIHI